MTRLAHIFSNRGNTLCCYSEPGRVYLDGLPRRKTTAVDDTSERCSECFAEAAAWLEVYPNEVLARKKKD